MQIQFKLQNYDQQQQSVSVTQQLITLKHEKDILVMPTSYYKNAYTILNNAKTQFFIYDNPHMQSQLSILALYNNNSRTQCVVINPSVGCYISNDIVLPFRNTQLTTRFNAAHALYSILRKVDLLKDFTKYNKQNKCQKAKENNTKLIKNKKLIGQLQMFMLQFCYNDYLYYHKTHSVDFICIHNIQQLNNCNYFDDIDLDQQCFLRDFAPNKLNYNTRLTRTLYGNSIVVNVQQYNKSNVLILYDTNEIVDIRILNNSKLVNSNYYVIIVIGCHLFHEDQSQQQTYKKQSNKMMSELHYNEVQSDEENFTPVCKLKKSSTTIFDNCTKQKLSIKCYFRNILQQFLYCPFPSILYKGVQYSDDLIVYLTIKVLNCCISVNRHHFQENNTIHNFHRIQEFIRSLDKNQQVQNREFEEISYQYQKLGE